MMQRSNLAELLLLPRRRQRRRQSVRLGALLILLVLLLQQLSVTDAFTLLPSFLSTTTRTTTTTTTRKEATIFSTTIFVLARDKGQVGAYNEEEEEEDNVAWSKDDDDDEEEEQDQDETTLSSSSSSSSSRWNKLNTRIKQRIVAEGQARAIANKKKREPAQDKKRRMMMYFKEKQREKVRDNKIKRALPFDQRTPLTVLLPGMNVTGTVISLTNFGAYVDIGTECDGLLHVSQITNDFFVEHPKQVLSPGEQVMVKIRSLSAEKKKLHLTMLADEVVQAEQSRTAEQEERIPLEEILVDDELWGELRRVTDYGAYVEVGAVVDGWLHFMDHPAWNAGQHPSQFMQSGDRVRVWVSDVDHLQNRIKLTANRPEHLPGPRRVV